MSHHKMLKEYVIYIFNKNDWQNYIVCIKSVEYIKCM